MIDYVIASKAIDVEQIEEIAPSECDGQALVRARETWYHVDRGQLVKLLFPENGEKP